MLVDVKSGDNAEVTKILSGNELIKRLAAMGIVEGSMVAVISNSGKGPILIESDGKSVAIGQGMAEKIVVRAV